MVALRLSSDRKRQLALSWLPRLVGPLILVVLITKVDMSQTIAIVASADPFWLAVAILLLPVILILRAHRWFLLLRAQSLASGFIEALAVYSFAAFIGTVTPGRLGEFVKVAHLRFRTSSVGEALVSVVADRLLDVLVVAFVGAAALDQFFDLHRFGSVMVLGCVTVAGLITGGLLMGRARVLSVMDNFLARALPGKFGSRVLIEGREFREGLKRISVGTWVIAALESATAWLVNWLGIYLMALAVGLTVPFHFIAGASAVSALLTLLPLSVLGVGTRDATLIILLSKVDVSQPEALALSSLTLLYLLSYALMNALSMFSPWGRLAKQESGASIDVSGRFPPRR